MFSAILSAVVAIGSSVMGMIATNKQADAVKTVAEEQRAAAEAVADANRYDSDTVLLGLQLDAMMANEKTKNYYAGLQVGVLVIGIVVLGIIAMVKKHKT
jgi:hypothetical protein